MNRSFLFALAAFVSLALAACHHSKPTTTTTMTPTAKAGDCPVEVPGTSVTVEDTPTGAALVFVTTGDAAAVRTRVHAWADAHNQHHSAMGPLPTGTEEGGGMEGMDHGDMEGMDHGDMEGMDHGDMEGMDHGDAGELATMINVHSRAVATDIDGGARLELVTFPNQVAKLRENLRMHAAHLAGGTCTMHHHA